MKNLRFLSFGIVLPIQLLLAQNNPANAEEALDKGLEFHYTIKDSAYHYYEQALVLADEENDLMLLLTTYTYLLNANGYHYDLSEYKRNIAREDSLLHYDKRLAAFEYLDNFTDYLLFDKGNYNYKAKDYPNSKKHFLELYAKLDAIPESERILDDVLMRNSINSFLGLIYFHTERYELAEYRYKELLQQVTIHKDSLVDWESDLYNTQKLLSQVYEAQGEFEKSSHLLEEAYLFYKNKSQDQRYKNNLLSTFVLLAKNHIAQDKNEEAIALIREGNQFYVGDNPFAHEIELLMGDAYTGLNNYKEAEKFYLNALKIISEHRQYEKHLDRARAYVRLGKLFTTQKQFIKGLDHYQKALAQLDNDFKETAFGANPLPEEVSSRTVLIEVLKKKLEALQMAYHNSGNSNFLRQARSTGITFLKTLDLLRPEFESKLDKRFLIEETYPTMRLILEIIYQLYQDTKDSKYIADAFHLMEKNRSIFLLEAHRRAEATAYGNVPADTIAKERDWRTHLTNLEDQLFDAEPGEQENLKYELLSAKNKYYEYIENFQAGYPRYYALKYNTKIAGLAEIKNDLKKDQALLSYMEATDGLYLIVLDRGSQKFLKLDFRSDMKEIIREFYSDISKPALTNSNAVYKKGSVIYEGLLLKALEGLSSSHLTIIADGLLHYIPFDILSVNKTERRYLLEDYAVDYAYSATLFHGQTRETRRNTPNNLLALAPGFDGGTPSSEGNEWVGLKGAETEVEKISAYFPSIMLKGNRATLENFKKEVNAYNLIHLATHASANDEYPNYSYLVFAADSSGSTELYVKDIYNYQLEADMVTLSGCQTGVGKLQNGEGMLSLARAFNYAGVPAVVTSLWKVNDRSGSKIMEAFYQNLKEGYSKTEALRTAKLDYLKALEDPLLQHPYFWAAFIVSGNTSAITKNYKSWYLAGGILLLFMAFRLIRKKLKKKSVPTLVQGKVARRKRVGRD